MSEEATNEVNEIMNNEGPVAGFQFNVDGTTVSGASGGDATSNGFMLSTSSTMVIAFSLTGGAIPAGCGTLVELSLDGDATGLINLVFSEPDASSMDITYYEGSSDDGGDDGGMEITNGCDLPVNNIYLLDGSVLYNIDAIIGGFQFTVDGATVSSAYGGDATENGFMLSSNSTTNNILEDTNYSKTVITESGIES